MVYDQLKLDLRHAFFSVAKIKRIHIIGCARSGTTFFHYSLIAFNNTILHDFETSFWTNPSTSRALTLSIKHLLQKGSFYYITKRDSEWFDRDSIDKFVNYTKKYNVHIINLLRDPRDVLTSMHTLSAKDTYYVSTDKWKKTNYATNKILKQLKQYKNITTIRYEDVLSESQSVQKILYNDIGLSLRENIKEWSRLKDNLEYLGGVGKMIPYLNKLRNFDKNSIGKWKNDEKKLLYIEDLLQKSDIKEDLKEFMNKYNYQI